MVLAEAARRIAEAAQRRASPPSKLIDHLLNGNAHGAPALRAAIANRSAPRDLVWAIQARWLVPSVAVALEAFTESCREDRSLPNPVPRMELLRFALRASQQPVRGSAPVGLDEHGLVNPNEHTPATVVEKRLPPEVPESIVSDPQAPPTPDASPSDGSEHREFLRRHGIRSAEDYDD